MNKQELITNKQELISKYELLKNSYDFKVVATDDIISDLKRLDEPEKVTIPQFVASWIEYCKFTHVNLQHALIVGDVYFYNYANQKDFSKLKEFLETENNQATFARAWLDGYEVGVEEEKEYKVVLLNYNDGHLNLVNVRTLGENIIFFTKKTQFDPRSLKLTKTEIISSGFGWVFDCPGIKIEEVKDE